MEYDEQHLEQLAISLNDDKVREEYKKPYDDYKPSLLPRILGGFIVMAGNIVFGDRPSYLKFRAVEVIARVPYHSWDAAAFTFMTACYQDSTRALALAHTSRFSRMAQDNETMHVVVISEIAAKEQHPIFLIHTLIPMLFAGFYYWMSYIMYIVKPRYSMELNYLFESHAYESYCAFLELDGDAMKKKPVDSEYLRWYGRQAKNHFELFQLIRNDELIHRNRSIREIVEGGMR